MRFAPFVVLLLSACTSLVPSTVMRLNGLSPNTADPVGFAVDLTLPAGIDIRQGTAQLMFGVTRSDTDEVAEGTFVLERTGSVFVIAKDDLPALRSLQAVARQWEEEAPAATEGTLGINLSPCLVGDGPAPDARVSVSLRLQEGARFLPLVRRGLLSAVASPEQIREMGACP